MSTHTAAANVSACVSRPAPISSTRAATASAAFAQPPRNRSSAHMRLTKPGRVGVVGATGTAAPLPFGRDRVTRAMAAEQVDNSSGETRWAVAERRSARVRSWLILQRAWSREAKARPAGDGE
eukprot:scaffold27864_cov90-Isochrysis_galbana.AAC.5